MTKRIFAILLTLVLLFTTACEFNRGKPSESQPNESQEQTAATEPTEQTSEEGTEALTDEQTDAQTEVPPTDPEESISETSASLPTVGFSLPIIGGYYYDVTSVVLYLNLYGELPPNFITKAEARELGWQGGSVENYLEGGAIGGDYFGNYDGLLPTAPGRSYTECDIDTDFSFDRGSKRLVFSNDGLYFYTSDHYESFSEVFVTEDYEVIW